MLEFIDYLAYCEILRRLPEPRVGEWGSPVSMMCTLYETFSRSRKT